MESKGNQHRWENITTEILYVSYAFAPAICLIELWAKPNRKDLRPVALPNILWSLGAWQLELWDLCGMWEGWKGLWWAGRHWQRWWIWVAGVGARRPLPWALTRASEVIQQPEGFSNKVKWSTNSLITVTSLLTTVSWVYEVMSYISFKYTLQSLKAHCSSIRPGIPILWWSCTGCKL